jgi:DNA-binding transcriptional regulator YdaS (Cro superfamily)
MKLSDYLSSGAETQNGLAKKLGVTQGAISQWIKHIRQIPAEQCPKIEYLTNRAVTCEEMRPDINWGYLRCSSIELGK